MDSTRTLILKWRTKTSETPITEMNYEDLKKAISITNKRLRPYRKQLNILKSLREEIERREEQAKKLAIQSIEGLEEGAIILIDSKEEVIADMTNRKEYYQRLAKNGKIVRMEFT